MISGKRRLPCEVLMEMLKLSDTPKAKSRLIQGVGIKYSLGLKYLSFLVENGCIEKVPPPRIKRRSKNSNWRKYCYKITVKGHELMEQIADGKHCVLFFVPSCSEEATE